MQHEPSITTPPNLDFLVLLHPAESVSDHITTFFGSSWNFYFNTTLLWSLTYLARRFVALQSCSSGFDVNLKISLAACCMSILSWPK